MKRIAGLIASLVLMFMFPVLAHATVWLDDQNDLYTDSQEQQLLEEMQRTADHTGWNIAIVTYSADYDPEAYGENTAYRMAYTEAERLYDEHFGVNSSGVLYLCDVGYRYVCVANNARNYIDGMRLQRMVTSMEKYYFDYDDMGHAREFLSRIDMYYDAGVGTSWMTFADFIPGIVGGIIAVIILIAAVWHRYKTPVAPSANEYLFKSGVTFTKRRDVFVGSHSYSYSNSSGGGGGGFHGGGGGHHGGGGHGGHR
ncbi:MAG: TPM domain-containing protein [Oscillospiraceae bacterium]|nr:TPM domain-containing protein [Oscillospiraceae bacterium]